MDKPITAASDEWAAAEGFLRDCATKAGAASTGYHDWRIEVLCGATPAFGWGGSQATVRCVAKPGGSDMWRAARHVMGQIAALHGALAGWVQQLEAGPELARDDHPLAAGWRALQFAMGVPGYPLQVVTSIGIDASTNREPDAAGLTLHTACPYDRFVSLGLQLAGQWLSWSQAAWQQGHLQLPRQQVIAWCAAFDLLAKFLPVAAVMRLHYQLWQQGIHWQWLGGERTRVGAGAHQRVVAGAPSKLPQLDPDAWRVPIYTVTGSVGKTTTARLLFQLLRGSGRTVALTASDGAWIGDQRVAEGDCIGGVTANALLGSPRVQAGVFEQGRRGIVKQGVPYARTDVAILLNVQAVHLGLLGIDTLEQMADTKAVGIRPARLAVLNHDDEQCRRLGRMRPAQACVWFSTAAGSETLRALSRDAAGAAGVQRDPSGMPQQLELWRAGACVRYLSLEGVAPYHGLLGDKTLEELLAAVAAAWFGPLPLDDWQARFRALHLDAGNHAFRTSVHHQGRVVFVLDKAAEEASLRIVKQAVEQLAEREACRYRIVVMCRPASEPLEQHLASAACLHGFIDEFICFDRPDSYTSRLALPCYSPGSIPVLLRDELTRLNAQHGAAKPVTIATDWEVAEAFLRERLAALPGRVLVLINQPSTGIQELNRRILALANGDRSFLPDTDVSV